MPPPPSGPRYYVLVTGYGPFANIINNPSWACTSPLHNAVLHTPSGATIHITVLGPVRVSYPAVLKLLPGIHARPPRLPTIDETESIFDKPLLDVQPPPEDGYDFVFHLGAGMNGAISLEQLGHKTGYSMPGVDGVYAPITKSGGAGGVKTLSEADKFENGRSVGQNVERMPAVFGGSRGFADGYEPFPEELRTEVDVAGLIAHLKRQGEARVLASTDAGHFLCDFICYGSLAESQRTIIEGTDPPPKRTKSLFMHVPSAVNSPFTVTELTAAVKQIVAWVCTGEAAV
ncbi:peptidase C15, pyroglutamyl peptidase I-like protein [Hysterangium stoloniferum]|nr:peptidase C15, pyroglutamyl peptidase I-like protein [Hysterangium stoloniferum]